MEYVGFTDIILGILTCLWPVWLSIAIIMGLSWKFQKKLSLYGRIYENPMGIVGLFIVFFWLFAALYADIVAPFHPLEQFAALKNQLPGVIEPESGLVQFFGGDKFGRDVFSRVIHGSQIVLVIAPAATMFAFVVGISLGLPAGYYKGKVDTVLSFLANLVLAFPVILLFYLLVTPGIRETALPQVMAGVFFLFPVIFFLTLFYSRYRERPQLLAVQSVIVLVFGGWVYISLVFDADPFGILSLEPNELNIFVAVVFASSPGVFRIVRGLTMDIATRDYVAAAQTRGEIAWYVALWEILPNARGPLIVDACLRIGYTTILLGTLGYFGLGLVPESPDWGTTIKEGSRLLRLYVHPALPPALALMSFVLGLNLLADALREQSLKD
ncbi:ABC transporter permease [Rhodospirillaceae bacterium KN72]|uniref:ABC transporter permease n=1 Tax=Pacificispira spongiicola TaxID=2729598 RepID=A0A7Y0HF02_9PROT|nr:ABC transporter permease [Pacificispira spongiicola]NMM43462.1 ABC transporter permease [Pacificispira spongiicola]